MAYADMRIKFDVISEDGYDRIVPTSLFIRKTDLSEAQLYSLAETAGQSDFYQVDVANAFLAAFDGHKHKI